MKNYTKLSDQDISFFEEIFGERMITDKEIMSDYAQDETEDLIYYPAVVVIPIDAKEISKTLKYWSEHEIPVTPSGARTGLSGGSLPVFGGVLISSEKLNKIIEID